MVYVLIVEDRHIDTEVMVFATAEAAIAAAKAWIAEQDPDEDDVEERQIKGRLYDAVYSCEGDSVSVVERDVLTEAPR